MHQRESHRHPESPPPEWRLQLLAELLEQSLRDEKARPLQGFHAVDRVGCSTALQGIKETAEHLSRVLSEATRSLSGSSSRIAMPTDDEVARVHKWSEEIMLKFRTLMNWVDHVRSQPATSIELELNLVTALMVFDFIELFESVPAQLRKLINREPNEAATDAGGLLIMSVTLSSPLLDSATQRFHRRTTDL